MDNKLVNIVLFIFSFTLGYTGRLNKVAITSIKK